MSDDLSAVSPIHHEIDEFHIDRESRNLTPKSIAWYEQSLSILKTYLTEQGITATRDITASNIRLFLIYLKDRGHNSGGRANIYGHGCPYCVTARYGDENTIDRQLAIEIGRTICIAKW